MVLWRQSPLASASVLHCDWILYEATKSDERPYGTLGPHCAASIPVAGPPPSVYFARWFRVLIIEGESRPYELRVLATESEVMEVWAYIGKRNARRFGLSRSSRRVRFRKSKAGDTIRMVRTRASRTRPRTDSSPRITNDTDHSNRYEIVFGLFLVS